MAKVENRKAVGEKKSGESWPYRDLYIYLLKGRLREDDEGVFGDAFLGNWVEEDSSFLFFSTPSEKAISLLLKSRPDLELMDDYQFTYEQWQGGGLDRIEVENFVIAPPWVEIYPGKEAIKIILDPGVVFGNGLHPTTRDCLKALMCAYRMMPFSRVLDIGTGTGVLALAAAFLGAERVLAADLNPLCVKTTIENVRLNDLGKIIVVVEEPAEALADEPADLVIANIHYEVIQSLLKRRIFRDNDRLILSGLMRSQAREVRARLQENHLRVLREWDHEMTWFTMLVEFG